MFPVEKAQPDSPGYWWLNLQGSNDWQIVKLVTMPGEAGLMINDGRSRPWAGQNKGRWAGPLKNPDEMVGVRRQLREGRPREMCRRYGISQGLLPEEPSVAKQGGGF